MEEATKKWIAIVVAVLSLLLLPVAYSAGRESIKREVRERIAAAAAELQKSIPSPQSSRVPTAPETPPVVTLNEFYNIKNGMTYEQVMQIIGDPGIVQSQTEMPGAPSLGIAPTVSAIYRWDNGGVNGGCSVQFRDWVVISKSQFGLH